MNDANRREFLKAAAAGLAMAVGAPVLAAEEREAGGIPKRPLGKTGEKVSIVGLGGWHIGSIPENEAIPIIHEAIDSGMTFFDSAWCYHDGGSEEVLGKGMATGGRRNKVFLMTKGCVSDYRGTMKCIEDSLRRMQTDRIDLWQFHEINYPDAPKRIFREEGIKAAVEAKKAGKIRHIGFTGHKDIALHLEMLAQPFAWEAVQMPINVLDAHYRSFQQKVVPVCNHRQIGVIGMKALVCGAIPKEVGIPAVACRRYALSLPISTLVCGITSRKDLLQDLGVARDFQPMTKDGLAELVAETKDAGRDGKLEGFKTTRNFDSGYHRKQFAVDSRQ